MEFDQNLEIFIHKDSWSHTSSPRVNKVVERIAQVIFDLVKDTHLVVADIDGETYVLELLLRGVEFFLGEVSFFEIDFGKMGGF